MLISPFFWLLAGLSGHSAANRRLTGKRLKSQGAKLSFSSVSVRWGRAGAFTLPQGTVAQRGRTLGNSRGRARRGEEKDRERDLPGAAAGFLPAAGNRRWDFSLPGKTGAVRGLAPGKNRVRARHGEERDTVRELPGAAARIARRRRYLRAFVKSTPPP